MLNGQMTSLKSLKLRSLAKWEGAMDGGVDFSPDGKVLASCCARTTAGYGSVLSVFHWNDSELHEHATEHATEIRYVSKNFARLCVSHDGRFLIGGKSGASLSSDRNCSIFRPTPYLGASGGVEVQVGQFEYEPVTSMAFCSDEERLVYGTTNGSVVMSLDFGSVWKTIINLGGQVTGLALKGNLLACLARDGTVRVYDVHRKDCSLKYTLKKVSCNCIALALLSGVGPALATGCSDGTVQIRAACNGGKVQKSFDSGYSSISCIAFGFVQSGDEQKAVLAVGNGGKMLKFFDCDRCIPVALLKQPRAVNSFAFSADGRFFATQGPTCCVYGLDAVVGVERSSSPPESAARSPQTEVEVRLTRPQIYGLNADDRVERSSSAPESAARSPQTEVEFRLAGPQINSLNACDRVERSSSPPESAARSPQTEAEFVPARGMIGRLDASDRVKRSSSAPESAARSPQTEVEFRLAGPQINSLNACDRVERSSSPPESAARSPRTEAEKCFKPRVSEVFAAPELQIAGEEAPTSDVGLDLHRRLLKEWEEIEEAKFRRLGSLEKELRDREDNVGGAEELQRRLQEVESELRVSIASRETQLSASEARERELKRSYDAALSEIEGRERDHVQSNEILLRRLAKYETGELGWRKAFEDVSERLSDAQRDIAAVNLDKAMFEGSLSMAESRAKSRERSKNDLSALFLLGVVLVTLAFIDIMRISRVALTVTITVFSLTVISVVIIERYRSNFGARRALPKQQQVLQPPIS